MKAKQTKLNQSQINFDPYRFDSPLKIRCPKDILTIDKNILRKIVTKQIFYKDFITKKINDQKNLTKETF